MEHLQNGRIKVIFFNWGMMMFLSLALGAPKSTHGKSEVKAHNCVLSIFRGWQVRFWM